MGDREKKVEKKGEENTSVAADRNSPNCGSKSPTRAPITVENR